MVDRINLDSLVQRVFDQDPHLSALQPVVVKELIHYEILWSLDQAGLLRRLTFHGGTALRLCYGGSRLSEDLDFTGGPRFCRADVDGISDVVKSHLTDRYGLEVSVKDPAPQKKTISPIDVDTWQISVITDPGKTHMPRQRIKIDIATMEARSRDVHAIQKNYGVLPSGLGDLLVPTMSKDEILSNKLISLPASVRQRNLRHRDIWDIAWLVQNGAQVNQHWIVERAAEFHFDDYIERLDDMRRILPEHVGGAMFRQEMSRFLPQDVVARTIERQDFSKFLVTTVDDCLAQARASYGGEAEENTWKM